MWKTFPLRPNNVPVVATGLVATTNCCYCCRCLWWWAVSSSSSPFFLPFSCLLLYWGHKRDFTCNSLAGGVYPLCTTHSKGSSRFRNWINWSICTRSFTSLGRYIHIRRCLATAVSFLWLQKVFFFVHSQHLRIFPLDEINYLTVFTIILIEFHSRFSIFLEDSWKIYYVCKITQNSLFRNESLSKCKNSTICIPQPLFLCLVVCWIFSYLKNSSSSAGAAAGTGYRRCVNFPLMGVFRGFQCRKAPLLFEITSFYWKTKITSNLPYITQNIRALYPQ